MGDRSGDTTQPPPAGTASAEEKTTDRTPRPEAPTTEPVRGAEASDDIEATFVRSDPPDVTLRVRTRNPTSLPAIERKRYEIVGEFARGGIGRILAAQDPVLDRRVALKELLTSDPHATDRFLREALTTARLQHPGIVPVYEAGRWPTGEPFYAMKLVSGRSLDRVIWESRSLEERLALLPNVLAVAETMAYAHGERIIHRDLKPGNIIIGAFGETIVIDWGLTKDLADPSEATAVAAGSYRETVGPQTIQGQVMGTPSYMPLEQAMGAAVDERADVYSIGAVLYHVLAGSPPYEGESAFDVLGQVIAGPPKPLYERQPGIPPDLLAIVTKSMARSSEDRYRTAKELADDLRRFQTGQLVGAKQYTFAALLMRWLRRNFAVVAIAATSAALLAVGGVITLGRILEERDRANRERAFAQEASRQAENARHREMDRADDLVLVEARRLLDIDPTASLAWLKRLAPASTRWRPARMIAADAWDRGAASLLTGHAGRVYSVAWATHGRHVASWAEDRTVRVWDLETKGARVIEKMGGIGDLEGGVDFTSDGRTLVVRLDGRVRLFDVEAGTLRFESEPAEADEADPLLRAVSPDGGLAALGTAAGLDLVRTASGERKRLGVGRELEPHRPVFSADGRWLASISPSTIRVFDLLRGGQRVFKVASSNLYRAAFSPKSSLLACFGRQDKDIQLFDLEAGTKRVLHGHAEPVASIVFSPEGQHLASAGSFDRVVRIWDLRSGVSQAHEAEASMMAFSPDGNVLAMVTFTKVELLDLRTGASRFLYAQDQVTALAFSPDGSRLATSGFDRTVRLWNLSQSSGERITNERSENIARFASSRNGLHLVTLSGDPVLHVRNLATGETKTMGSPISGRVGFYQAAFSPDGRTLAVAGAPPRVFDVQTSDGRDLFGASEGAVAVGYAEDGAILAVAKDGTVRRYSPDQKESSIACQLHHLTADHDLTFSDDGRYLTATGPYSDRAELCDLEARRVIDLGGGGTEGAVRFVAFSPDGRRLAAAGHDPVLRVRDTATGTITKMLAGSDQLSWSVAFSPGGEHLASGETDVIRLWNLSTGVSEVLRGHSGNITALSFSRDGQLLASSAQDATVRLWDMTSRESRALRGHEKRNVAAVSFLPSGKQLISAGDDGTVRIWRDDLPWDGPALLAWLRSVTNATIGVDETLTAE